MFPNPITPTIHIPHADTRLRRLLGGMSFFTMLMTIPLVLTIWFGHQAAGFRCYRGVPTLSLPFCGFGSRIQKHDKNIYLPCVGWMLLDSV
jgi:hypothetical protein